MKIIAHRGLAKEWPENTIPAFLAAVKVGVDMIELDIHETKDGEFIVFHNPQLSKKDKPWSELTYSEVRDIRGDNFAPRLSECIKQLPGMPLNIEIKTVRNLSAFVEYMEKNKLAKGSVLSSFDLHTLKSLYQKKIDFPLHLILSISRKRTIRQNFCNSIFRLFPSLLPKYLQGVSIYQEILSSSLVSQLHKNKLAVYPYTINKQGQMDTMTEWGVDGVFTDRADIFTEGMSS